MSMTTSTTSDAHERLAYASRKVLRATDAYIDAQSGLRHRSEPHDRLWAGLPSISGVVDDCAACGGAQYGAEDDLHGAIGDLRAALGEQRKALEYKRAPASASVVPHG